MGAQVNALCCAVCASENKGTLVIDIVHAEVDECVIVHDG